MHLLPVYPSTGDGGFAPTTHQVPLQYCEAVKVENCCFTVVSVFIR